MRSKLGFPSYLQSWSMAEARRTENITRGIDAAWRKRFLRAHLKLGSLRPCWRTRHWPSIQRKMSLRSQS